MAYYVYILQSKTDNTYYKGFTENPLHRLAQHNAGEMNYTSKKMPWNMVCLFVFETKQAALIFERKIKKYDHARLNSIINSEKNILTIFLKG